jgi:hypothetical protein
VLFRGTQFASFHTIEHQISKSAPFRARAKFEPLSIPLQNDLHFLLRSFTLYAVNSLHRVSTSLLFFGEEHIGFTKFHTTNNVNTLEATYKPRIICPLAIMSADPLQPDSVPFGLSVSTCFRLFDFTIFTMVHFTFFIAFLS